MSTQIYQTYTFNPTKISGCQLWLDAADLTTLFTNAAGTTAVSASGQSIGYWKDKSTQANNATNSTNQPTVIYNTQNGLPVIDFVASSSQFLNLDATKLPNGSTNFSYFFVVRTSSSATQVFFANGVNTAGRMPQFYFLSNKLYGDLYGGNAILDGTVYNNQWAVAAYTGGAQFNGYDYDVVFSDTNNINITLNTGTTYATIGRSRDINANPVFYLTGQLGEIIVYNRIVTASERQQIEAYLGWKWDLANNFLSSFPYFKNPPFMNQIQLPATPSGPIAVYNAPVFTPTQISGTYLWLDASTRDNFRFSGVSNISAWIDRSGNSYTATAANNPTYDAINKRVRFNNSLSQSMSNTSAPLNLAARSFFFVIEDLTYISVGGYMPMIPNPTSGTDYQTTTGLTIENNTGFKFYGNSGGYDNKIVGSANPNPKAIYSEVFGSLSGTTYLNGTAGGTSNSSYTPGTSAGYALGARWANGIALPYINAYYYEVIVYNSALSTTNRQRVEGYLAWKWGLQASLPTNHPYYKSPFPNMGMAPTPPFPPQISQSVWLPTRISGISLWLDAADKSTLTGTTVTSWTDKSGAGNTATASAGPIQSTYNNYPVLSFNGSSQFMNSTNTIPRTTHTLIAVHRPATITGNYQGNTSLFRYQATNYIVFPYMLGTTPRGYITNADGTGAGSIDFQNSTLVENSVTNSLNIIIAVISSGSQIIYKNGTQQSSDTETLTGGTSDSLIIGRLSASGEYYQGDLGEMIVYPTALSTRNRQNIEGYLAWKWGLVSFLPSTHPYKLFPPVP